MPVYCFICPECKLTGNIARSVDDRNEPHYCTRCFTRMKRNIRAEAGEFRDTPNTWPMISDALGVHPDQIAEAVAANRAFGDNVTYTSDGRAILESRAQRKAHCRHQGLFDKSGGYGDA